MFHFLFYNCDILFKSTNPSVEKQSLAATYKIRFELTDTSAEAAYTYTLEIHFVLADTQMPPYKPSVSGGIISFDGCF